MKVTFTGDISITGSFADKVASNSEIFSDTFLSDLKKADFVVGNLEGPTTNSKNIFNYNTPLKSPVNTINYLHQRNISVFNLANNHILDFGELGLKKTLAKIKVEDCASFGAALTKEKSISPEIIHKNGISIALFGITKCTPTKINNAQLFSSDHHLTLKKQLKSYKNKVDFMIVNFHGGEEFSLYPSPVKRKFLKKIAALEEVNCVIAHHSHTLQGYEKYKNTYIFYSLGNFIFDIPNHKPYPETNNSALLNLYFTKSNFTFSFTPFRIDEGKINSINQEIFQHKFSDLCNFSNHKKKWQKEAFRILFRKENPKLKHTLKDSTSLQNKSFLSVIRSKKFHKKTFAILKDEYQFSLYFHAIIYKIKKKFAL
jgi:poly-gamma-glutamate synthesis protein (capsule biosynthesis protein)